MMSINAVKGVEIGAGMGAAELTGEQNADEIRIGRDGQPCFLSNHAGGILGGISTGQPDRLPLRREADVVHPDAAQDDRSAHGSETDIVTKGRHDPCVGISAVPIGEAMMAIVLADQFPAPSRPDRLTQSAAADLKRDAVRSYVHTAPDVVRPT